MAKTIGIFMHGQCGDILSAMSVLRYRQELWGDDCKIVWYASKENWDALAYQDLEVREFPRGFGHPDLVEVENKKLIAAGQKPVWEDWKPLVDKNNHLDLELKKNYPSLDDIDLGYFPAPHQVDVLKRADIEYPNVSKMIFGVPVSHEWHPSLRFSVDDAAETSRFINDIRSFVTNKVIAIETFGGSSQSILSDSQVRRTMEVCESMLMGCTFLFVSHKYLNGNESFPEDITSRADVFSAKQFSVRQCGLLISKCDLFISVSSGISVAAQCWATKGAVPPILQYCGSAMCSTRAFASGRFELVETYNKSVQESLNEYETKLIDLLKYIK